MLTGMVQCRHPDQIRQARKATEEYLKQLNALHPLGLPPAGRPTVSSEAIPYYFAWRRTNDGQADDSMPSIGTTGVQQKAVPAGDEAEVEAGEGLEGEGLEEDRGAEVDPSHSSPFTAPRAGARARHEPTHPPALRASAPEGVAAADLEAGLVSTPPRRIFKPFKPLHKRRHKPLSPKIGSACAYRHGDANDRGAEGGGTDAEDESSIISGESLGPPEFTTEYQRSFQWPKGFFGSIISKPAAADRQRASEAGIRGARAEGVASQRAGEVDHLWELLKLTPTIPVATAAGARPRTDQVWDLLLQPTATMPAPPAPLPPPPPRATVKHEVVIDEEGERGEAVGEAPPPRAPLEGAVEPSAPTHARVAPPSEPPTTPARRSVITSATTTPARGTDRRGGGVGVDAARLQQQQQRQAGEMERRGKRPLVAFGRTVRTPPPPPASEMGEGERGGGGKQGKRKKLVIRGRKPVRTFRSSFNPIFMNPRYPTTRPGSPEHRHSVYQSSFSWPSVSPLMQSIS